MMTNESTLLTSNSEAKNKIIKDNNRFEVAQETSKDFINIFQENIDKKNISFPDNITSLLQDDLKQFSFKNFDNYTVNENTDSNIIWKIFQYDLPIEKVQELEDSINYTLNSISELHKTTGSKDKRGHDISEQQKENIKVRFENIKRGISIAKEIIKNGEYMDTTNEISNLKKDDVYLVTNGINQLTKCKGKRVKIIKIEENGKEVTNITGKHSWTDKENITIFLQEIETGKEIDKLTHKSQFGGIHKIIKQ